MPDTPSPTEVLDTLEFFQDALFKISEYRFPDSLRYARLRAELLIVPGLASKLPRYAREFETPEEVWGFVKRFDKTWEGRRIRIRESLQPAIDWVRQGMAPSAQEVHLREAFAADVRRLVVTDSPAPSQERKVVVFGPDDTLGLPRLKAIQSELGSLGHESHLIRDLPDVPDQSVEQKARVWALLGPFAVMEDTVAGGQLVEYEYCKEMGVTLVVLRERGRGSTWMIKESDSLTYPFIRFIEYDPANLRDAVAEGVLWATELSRKKEQLYREKEAWRTRGA